MHRKLFVMIGCAAVVVGSAVARSLEGWKLPMVADYEEAPISCNHYNLANYSFNTVSTKVPAPPAPHLGSLLVTLYWLLAHVSLVWGASCGLATDVLMRRP